MATDAPPSGSLIRWLLPVGLFVGIVGAIAWVSQNLPKGAAPKAQFGNGFVEPEKAAHLRFLRNRAIWDEKDPNYIKECETGVAGYYDFPFLNESQSPVTLGFSQSNCDCSRLMVVVFEPSAAAEVAENDKKQPTEYPAKADWKWVPLTPNEKAGISIPAGGGGVARVEWDGRKGAGSRLRLTIKMWMHPTANPGERSFENLEVPVIMAEPVRFAPDRLSLGTISADGQVRGEMLAWSPTRDNLDLKRDLGKVDELFDVAIDKIDDKAAAELQDKFFVASVAHFDPDARAERLLTLRESAKGTRYRSAFRIHVTLHEQKGGKQLDQGPLSRELPVVAEDIAIEWRRPMVTAYVKGDVLVGNAEDAGKINLSFLARDGVKKTVPLWSEAGNDLTLDLFNPRVLNVELKQNKKESNAARSKWSLEISVPPGAWSGPFLDDSVIYLRTSSPLRKIRIPITGNASQG